MRHLSFAHESFGSTGHAELWPSFLRRLHRALAPLEIGMPVLPRR